MELAKNICEKKINRMNSIKDLRDDRNKFNFRSLWKMSNSKTRIEKRNQTSKNIIEIIIIRDEKNSFVLGSRL